MKSFKLIIVIVLMAGGLAYYFTHTGKKGSAVPAGNKILFYRNPMNPAITSPVPSKDDMGMDYIPVYENERPSEAPVMQTHAAVSADPGQTALLGIKTERVRPRHLYKRIYVQGYMAHDMELYEAQAAYIRALISGQVQYDKEYYSMAFPRRLNPSVIETAQIKLIDLGMDEESIAAITKDSYPDKRLIHLGDKPEAWLYMDVYENDLPFIHKGDKVHIQSLTGTGKEMEAEVKVVSPYANADKLTVKVRALVREGHELLKPNMAVSCVILGDMGTQLSIAEDAPLWTGSKAIVFVKKEASFEPREVVLGEKAGGFYTVTSGLKEGDEIVSQGNFFIDSDSRLNAASQNAAMALAVEEKS